MTLPASLIFPVVANGATVSSPFPLRNARDLMLWAPALTSCAVFLQGAFDTTSANFVRMTNPAGSGQFVFAAGPGSAAVVTAAAAGVPWARIECGVAQGSVRSFAAFSRTY